MKAYENERERYEKSRKDWNSIVKPFLLQCGLSKSLTDKCIPRIQWSNDNWKIPFYPTFTLKERLNRYQGSMSIEYLVDQCKNGETTDRFILQAYLDKRKGKVLALAIMPIKLFVKVLSDPRITERIPTKNSIEGGYFYVSHWFLIKKYFPDCIFIYTA